VKPLLAGLTVLLAASVGAEPIVIKDYGGRDSGVPKSNQKVEGLGNYKPVPLDDRTRYPIRSQLRPGYLDKPQKLRQPVKGAQPFFVVGNDSFSRDWIEKNKRYLQKIGAQGLATNIANKNEFDALASLVKPLPLVAVPMDEIAVILNFNVYPVLVTGEEIAQ
jgi:integrating conjugative element protein (TIGR03765 family)